MAASVGYATRTCAARACERPVGTKGARGLCPLHYQRVLRGVSVDGRTCETCDESIETGKYCSDGCKPRCTVEGCGQPQRKRSWCASHYAQWTRTRTTPVPFKWKWNSDEVTYSAVHERLRMRGSAAEHPCRHCDGQALQWAYDHRDVNERTDETGLRYSTDLSHYMPLCASCHKKFDLAARRGPRGVDVPRQGGD